MKKIIKSLGIVSLLSLLAFLAYPYIPQPMKKPAMTKINETTYSFHDGFVSEYMYLLIGEEKALLIDTGYGVSKLKEAVEEVTDLPVIVVNTHGHYDHTGNNAAFDEVYLSDKDLELYHYYYEDETLDMVYDKLPWIFRHLTYQEKKTVKTLQAVPVKSLPKEGYFDLGGRRVSFIETPGHTPGSIILLDENSQTLFDGDMAGVLLNLPLSETVETYWQSTKLINQFIADKGVKTIYSGHSSQARQPEMYRTLEQAAADIVEGRLSEEELASGKYTREGMTIEFYPDKIKN